MEVFWVILAAQAIVCAALSNYVAKQKGYDPANWGVLGFFLGIIALIAVAGLPVKKLNQGNQIIKTCYDCLEPINAKALVCKYCGCRYSKESILKYCISKLNDDSEVVQRQAINYLFEQKDPSTLTEILSYVENYKITQNVDPYPFKKALLLLTKFEVDGISGELLRMLEGTKQNYKSKLLIEAIAVLKDESTIPAVLKHLDDHASLSYEAQLCLLKFGNTAIPYLEKYSADVDKKTKQLIENIIAKIKEKQV